MVPANSSGVRPIVSTRISGRSCASYGAFAPVKFFSRPTFAFEAVVVANWSSGRAVAPAVYPAIRCG